MRNIFTKHFVNTYMPLHRLYCLFSRTAVGHGQGVVPLRHRTFCSDRCRQRRTTTTTTTTAIVVLLQQHMTWRLVTATSVSCPQLISVIIFRRSIRPSGLRCRSSHVNYTVAYIRLCLWMRHWIILWHCNVHEWQFIQWRLWCQFQ